MLSAALKALQLFSRQSVRGVLSDLSKPTSVSAATRWYSTGPPNYRNGYNHISPGRFADESDTYKSPESSWKQREEDTVKRLPPAPTKYEGRTVYVNSADLGRTFDRLNGLMRQNNVSREVFRQERHEKKGYKRRRLRSERWRRRFAHEVRKKVQLVNEIRARGA